MKINLHLILAIFLSLGLLSARAATDESASSAVEIAKVEANDDQDQDQENAEAKEKRSKEAKKNARAQRWALIRSINNWSIAGNAGFSILDADQSQKPYSIIPKNSLSFAASADVEYTFSPRFGLNVQYNYSKYKGYVGSQNANFNGSIHEVTLNGTFNLLNIFFRKCRNQAWNLYTNVGVGAGLYHAVSVNAATSAETQHPDGAYTISMPIGLNLEYNPIEDLAISLKAEYHMFHEDDLDLAVKGMNSDNMGGLYLGLRWKIINKDRKHMKNLSMCEYDSPIETKEDKKALEQRFDEFVDQFNKEILPTLDEIADANKEAIPEEDQAANAQRRAEVVPVAGVFVDDEGKPLPQDEVNAIINRIVDSNIPSIFFDLNSTALTDYANNVVAELANRLIKDSKLKLEIIGYTDMIGTTYINMDISIRRAKTVRDILVKKYGIDASRIKAIGKGEINNGIENFMPNRRCDFILSK